MGYDMHWKRDHSDEGYFRANIWGMQLLRDFMKTAGVLDLVTDSPPWPEIEQKEDEDEEDFEARLQDAYEPVKSFRSPDPGKVPIVKFCSNDGWIVLPDEARIIANGVRRLVGAVKRKEAGVARLAAQMDSEDTIDFVQDWVDYCQKCADEDEPFGVY